MMEPNHFHSVSLEFSIDELFELLAFIGWTCKEGFSLDNSHSFAFEGQDLHEGHPDVLIERMIEQILFYLIVLLELHIVKILEVKVCFFLEGVIF